MDRGTDTDTPGQTQTKPVKRAKAKRAGGNNGQNGGPV
jgi:hypothetical protein